MHLRYDVYLSRAKDIKDAFEVCPTPDPCLVVKGQRHMRFPGVPRTKSSILLTIRIHQIRWRVTGLPTTFGSALHQVLAWEASNTDKQVLASSSCCLLREYPATC
jgi:hypothetical protein